MLSPGYVEPIPPMIGPFTATWGFVEEIHASIEPSSGNYENTNRGVWFPLFVPSLCVARRMWWANGSSVTGNVEAGIYLDATYKPGAKLITTGSVAQATTNVVQFSDITDTTLPPDLYWLYISSSSTSATFFRSAIHSLAIDELFRFEQASIGPGSAPATATPVESTATSIYLFGFSTTTIT